MSGATPLAPSLNDSTLLLLDAQEEYRIGRLPLAGIEAAVAAIVELLALARWRRAPIVHVVQQGRPGGLFDPAAECGRIMPEVAPQRDETLITKRLPNAFAGTALDAVLRRSEHERLVIAGFMTHVCVSTTVRAALDLGYASIVVADAVATRDLPDPLCPDQIVPAGHVHAVTLAALGDRFATIATTSQLD